jgi:hypothetical protein
VWTLAVSEEKEGKGYRFREEENLAMGRFRLWAEALPWGPFIFFWSKPYSLFLFYLKPFAKTFQIGLNQFQNL